MGGVFHRMDLNIPDLRLCSGKRKGVLAWITSGVFRELNGMRMTCIVVAYEITGNRWQFSGDFIHLLIRILPNHIHHRNSI